MHHGTIGDEHIRVAAASSTGLRLDPAALGGFTRPRGGDPAASQGQGSGGRAEG